MPLFSFVSKPDPVLTKTVALKESDSFEGTVRILKPLLNFVSLNLYI